MPSADIISATILELTQHMDGLALNGDLEAFVKTQRERDAMVDILERDAHTMDNPERVRDNLLRAQALNQQMMDHFTAAQKTLLNEKSTISKGLKMKQAYGANR